MHTNINYAYDYHSKFLPEFYVVSDTNTLKLGPLLTKEQLQQLRCRIQQQTDTSSTGGWCNNYVHSGHATDRSLAAALSTLLIGKKVIGLGDGPGEYKKLLLASGNVREYDAFDGAPNIARITNGQVFCGQLYFFLTGLCRLNPVTVR